MKPWWMYVNNVLGPLSLPMYLLLIMPAVLMATNSVTYAVCAIGCYMIGREAQRVDADKPWAPYAYAAAFVTQLALLAVIALKCWSA